MGLRPRKIAISFWRVNAETENDFVTEYLAKAFDALDCKALDSIGKGATHALDCYGVEEKDGYITGALVSNQHAGLPLTYTQRRKEFGLVPLQEGQGLGRVSCFVFEKRRRLLLLESPGEGSATARDWCQYFHAMLQKSKTGKERIPILRPAIVGQLDARSIFNKFIRITKLRVHMARLRDVSMFKDEAALKTTTSAFPGADKSGSDEVICEFKVPSKPNKKQREYLGSTPTLERKFVHKFVDACEALGPGEITVLEVSGEEEDVERMTVLNLLANRVSDFISAVPFTDKELPSPTAVRHRCDLIIEMFEKHATVLQSVGGK